MLKNLLLATFLEVLMKTNMLCAIILLILGLSLSMLATRIAKAVRKTSKINADDRLVISLQIIGLVLMVFGFICIIL